MRQHHLSANRPARSALWHAIVSTILLAVLCWGNWGPARAQQPSAGSAELPIVIVLDASGSMSARLGDEARLDAARRVVLDTLSVLPPDRGVGLVAYGHRRKGDCADIETLLPIGPVDLPGLRGALDRLQAKGKTPLSAALRQAAEMLPAAGGTVMLVSDGLETCAADPCAVAAAIHAANANIIFHIVGLGLKPGEMGDLACIADNGGGQAIETSDAAELAEALTTLTDAAPPQSSDAATAPTVAEPEAQPLPPPTPRPVALRAMVGGQEAPGPVLFSVVSAAGDTVYEGAGITVTPDLVAGDYVVRVSAGNLRSETAVTVTGAVDERHDLPLEAGRLHLSVTAAADLPIADTDLRGAPSWTLSPLDQQGAVAIDAVLAPDVLLVPGRYRIGVTLGGFAQSAEVDIVPGTETALQLDLGLGKVALEAGMPGIDRPIESGTGLSWSLLSSDAAMAPLSADAVAQPSFLVKAGAYRAQLTIGGAEITQDVTAEPGRTVRVRVDLPSAELRLEGALGSGAPAFADWRDASWTVRPVALLGGVRAGPALENQAEANPVLVLTPGEWEVTLVSGAASVTRRLSIAPGAKATERIELAAGRLSISAAPEPGAPAPRNVLVSIFASRADGSFAEKPIVEAGTPRDYATVLPAGRYRIDATDETGRSATAILDVVSGQSPTLEMSLK